MSREVLYHILLQLLAGMQATLLIFALTLLFSLPLGMIICVLRMCKLWLVSWPTKIFISVLRGTPLMLQLLVVFFGPYYLFGIRISDAYRFPAVIIAFSINYAAYFAEIFRGGIQAVPVGQREAALVLGYSRGQTFFKIILPQVVKNTLPAVTNEVITLTKDTSLAFALAYTEMFTLAKQLSSSQRSMIPYIAAGVLYYLLNFVVAYFMERLEKHYDYYH